MSSFLLEANFNEDVVAAAVVVVVVVAVVDGQGLPTLAVGAGVGVAGTETEGEAEDGATANRRVHNGKMSVPSASDDRSAWPGPTASRPRTVPITESNTSCADSTSSPFIRSSSSHSAVF